MARVNYEVKYMTMSKNFEQVDGVGPVVGGTQGNPPSVGGSLVRWVQYQAPVFVRVQSDVDGQGGRVTKVIVVADPGDLHLARDGHGRFLVYDNGFDPLRQDDSQAGLNLVQTVSIAEDRHRWPDGHLVALGNGWDSGPDPRIDPAYYPDRDCLPSPVEPAEGGTGLAWDGW
ncbi:hypothetical protein FRAHR75_670032 [Frankia sp. Hr75.2]|nr:hypothetical protein FRAHR75_670032 [Frankia sp. Hr75.2]